MEDRLSEARPGWLGAAVLLELASCLGFVATMRLVLKRAPARPVRRLAWAEMAFGAVVPVGGAGGLAVGAWAMRGWGLSWRRVLERSAVLFLLTSAVNAVVLAAAGLGVWLIPSAAHRGGLYGFLPALAAIVLLGGFVALPRVVDRLASRRSPSRSVAELAGWVRATERTAFSRDWRLLGAAGYLICDIAVLWACLHAFGADPSLPRDRARIPARLSRERPAGAGRHRRAGRRTARRAPALRVARGAGSGGGAPLPRHRALAAHAGRDDRVRAACARICDGASRILTRPCEMFPGAMSEDAVLQERRGQILLVTLNRPDARNAVNSALAHGIAAALDVLDADDELQVGVLTGAGKGFSAGMDLKAFVAGESPWVEGRGFAGITRLGVREAADRSGGGLCGGRRPRDRALLRSDRGRQQCAPRHRRGEARPGGRGGALIRLPKRIPYHVAMELALTGEFIEAPRAYELGLLNRVVEPGGAVDAAIELAETIAQNAPLSLAASKLVISRAQDWDEAEAWTKQDEIVAP